MARVGKSTPAGARSDVSRRTRAARALHRDALSTGLPRPRGTLPEETVLHSMVTGFLREQHRNCEHPTTTLPPLSLVQPHKCPNAVSMLPAKSSVVRLLSRQWKVCASPLRPQMHKPPTRHPPLSPRATLVVRHALTLRLVRALHLRSIWW